MDKSAFVRVQVRVSRRASPALYDYLTVAAKNGESESSALKRLAEEAFMLRSHPLIKAVQTIDLQEKNTKTLLSEGLKESNKTEKKFFSASMKERSDSEPQEARKESVAEADAPKKDGPGHNESMSSAARADGGSALAALLVARTRGMVGPARS